MSRRRVLATVSIVLPVSVMAHAWLTKLRPQSPSPWDAGDVSATEDAADALAGADNNSSPVTRW